MIEARGRAVGPGHRLVHVIPTPRSLLALAAVAGLLAGLRPSPVAASATTDRPPSPASVRALPGHLPGDVPAPSAASAPAALGSPVERGAAAASLVTFDARGGLAPAPRLLRGAAGLPLVAAGGPDPPGAFDPAAVAASAVRELLRPAGELSWLGSVPGARGSTHVTFEQRFDGVPVRLGRIRVTVLASGDVLSIRTGELAAAGPARRPDAAPAPAILLDLLPRALAAVGGAAAVDATFDEVLVPVAGQAVFARRLRFGLAEAPHVRHEVVLDADSGAPLVIAPATFHAIEAARVFPVDPHQGAAWVTFPHPVLRPSVDSPAGWSHALETIGNNASVHLDRLATFDPPSGGPATASGDPQGLDFPFTGDPAADADLALANVFVAVNVVHDRFRRLGFDEPSGALQADNFGRGGRGGDALRTLVQWGAIDGRTANNTMALGAGPDGSWAYLVAGVFDLAGELRDGALDTSLLVHELAHAASIRLVGDDAACLNGVQPAALSEGWSDFFAASFTGHPVIGAFTSGNAATGHRQRALDDNQFSLFNLCADGCNRFRDGEIWGGALWSLREALVVRHGAEAGVEIAERLVVEGLRQSPCRPTFLDARDALLVADSLLFDGAHHCLAWSTLAARGLGWSASTSGPGDAAPLPAFNLPPQCSGGAAVRFDEVEYGLDAEAVVEVVHASPPPSAEVTITSSRGDSLVVPLEAAGAGPVLRARVRLEPGAVVAGDDVLQVAHGDTLTATYLPAPAPAMATVSGAAAIEVLYHWVYGNCRADPAVDEDHVPGFYTLPGFLDAGETATLLVRLGNATAGDLEEATVLVESQSPRVTVLPSAPLPVGTVGRRIGTGPRPFDVEIRAQAAPDVVAGETADLRFTVAARGRTGTATLRLTLNMDYLLESARSPFAGGTETFDPATSPTVGQWTHRANRPPAGRDDWRHLDCAGAGGGWGYGNAGPDCASYGDGQAAPVLVSPPILADLPPDAVAMRLTDLSWSNHVQLWTDPANPYCDADLVAMFLTLDPDALPYDDPLGVFGHGPQRVWLFTENTPGHVRQGPYFLDTGPQAIAPGFPYELVRLAWVFWSSVIDCGFETSNQGHYLLDDVRFTHDVVRQVPQATPCDGACLLRAELALDPPGPKCPGEAFTLRAGATEAAGCDGPLRFAFGGPGVPPEAGWTYEREAPAVGEDGATYWLYARCEDTPACDDYRQALNVAPSQPGIGGVSPGSLRVRREGGEFVLRAAGAAVPPSFGAYLATTREQLQAAPAGWDLAGVGEQDGGGAIEVRIPLESGAQGGVTYLRIHPRDPCTGAAR